MRNRKLVLRREELTELADGDLADVAGAQPDAPTYTCPDYTYYCLTGYAMCERRSITCP